MAALPSGRHPLERPTTSSRVHSPAAAAALCATAAVAALLTLAPLPASESWTVPVTQRVPVDVGTPLHHGPGPRETAPPAAVTTPAPRPHGWGRVPPPFSRWPAGAVTRASLLCVAPLVAATLLVLRRLTAPSPSPSPSLPVAPLPWACAAHAASRDDEEEGYLSDGDDEEEEMSDSEDEGPRPPPRKVTVTVGNDNRNVDVRVTARGAGSRRGGAPRGHVHVRVGDSNDRVGITIDDAVPEEAPHPAEHPADDSEALGPGEDSDGSSPATESPEDPEARLTDPEPTDTEATDPPPRRKDPIVVLPASATVAPGPADKSVRVLGLARRLWQQQSNDRAPAADRRFSGWVAELKRRDELAELAERMECCVRVEDYQEAARLRNELQGRLRPDDRRVLQTQLEAAVRANDFAAAVALRDRLRAVEAQRWAFPVDPKGVLRGHILLRTNTARASGPASLQHTVVLLLMHNKAGSMGLIINRLLGPATPEDAPPFVEEIEALKQATGTQPWLFDGGIAAVKSITVLHQQRDAMTDKDVDIGNDRFELFANARHAAQLNPTFIQTVKALKHEPHGSNATRVFYGHVVWQSGVLDREIREGLWFPAAVAPALLFSDTSGDKLWAEIWDLAEEWCEQHLAAAEVAAEK